MNLGENIEEFKKNFAKIFRGIGTNNEDSIKYSDKYLYINDNIDYKGIFRDTIDGNLDIFNNNIFNSTDNKINIQYSYEDLALTSIFNKDNSYNNNTIIVNKELYINKNENSKINIIKKKRIFNVVYPNTFFIFNKGGNDHYIRKYIEDSLKPLHDNKGEFLSNFKNSKRIKCKRQENADNIRKKIKATFLKTLKNQVNKKLKLGGSVKIFNYLQQTFISNISKQLNGRVLDLTFEQLFSTNFCKDKKDIHSNFQKYEDNISVIKYLDERPEISKKSNYKLFKDIKYYQIFNEYLRSKEFEIEINRLKQKYNLTYINKYIKLAVNLNEFFYN